MESNKKVELINQTIQKLIEEKKKKKSKDVSSFDDRLLLSTLLSQLESLQEEESSENETTPQVEEITSASAGEIEAKNEDGGGGEIGKEEIVNELRKVRKQNLITHCLLSVMIVLTVAWQFSEMTLILKFKDGLSHPFRSVGSMLMGMLKGPQNNGDEAEKQEQQHPIEASSLHSLKMPELPHVDLPELHLNGEKH